jgi:hypothetical protein
MQPVAQACGPGAEGSWAPTKMLGVLPNLIQFYHTSQPTTHLLARKLPYWRRFPNTLSPKL